MKNILILVPTKNSWLYLPRLVDSLKNKLMQILELFLLIQTPVQSTKNIC